MSASRILCIRDFIEARIVFAAHGFTSPCWDWQLKPGPGGYAYGSPPSETRRKTRRMSRAAYEAYVEPIPDGLEIDHLCRNRRCVNPDHLEAVTRAENMRRMTWKRTVCLHGHPFEGDNIKVFADGRRVCRTCSDAWWASELERRKTKRREAAV